MKRCTLCADLPLGPRPVFQIDRRARILIASQAPGRKAHASGIPFDDPSGERLRQWLGVDRATFYDPAAFAIVPMGLCYPGTGPQGDLAPRPLCARNWRAQLLSRLPRLELTLAIGRHAIRWHLPKEHKAVLASMVREAHGPTIALPHPSPRNNRWFKANPWFEDETLPKLRARIATLLRT